MGSRPMERKKKMHGMIKLIVVVVVVVVVADIELCSGGLPHCQSYPANLNM